MKRYTYTLDRNGIPIDPQPCYSHDSIKSCQTSVREDIRYRLALGEENFSFTIWQREEWNGQWEIIKRGALQ